MLKIETCIEKVKLRLPKSVTENEISSFELKKNAETMLIKEAQKNIA